MMEPIDINVINASHQSNLPPLLASGEFNPVTGVYTCTTAATVLVNVNIAWLAGVNKGTRTLRIRYNGAVAKESQTQADPLIFIFFEKVFVVFLICQ